MKLLLHLIVPLLIVVTAQAQESAAPLRIEGSNVFGEKLGPLLIDGFKAKFPAVSVELKRPGSGEGLAALIAGRADIAPTSRPADEQELAAAKSANVRLRSQAIGSYGVAIIVNDSNSVRGLNPDQVRGIFTGKLKNWKQVGGPDLPIKVFALNKSTGARVGFQLLAMKGDAYGSAVNSLGDYAQISKAVADDPAAIGYTGIGAPAPGTRQVLINGQPANTAAIYERVYPYANTLYLYTIARRESPETKKFMRFVLSRPGQRILQDAGYAPRLPSPPSASANIAL